jgi:Tol biopolymer transport system component
LPLPARSTRHYGLFVLALAVLFVAGCGGSGDGATGATTPQKGLHFLDASPIADTIVAPYARSIVVELRGDNGRPIAGAPVTISSRLVDPAQGFAAFFATLPLPIGVTEPTRIVNTDGSGRAQVFMQLGYRKGAGFVIADAGGGRRDSIAVTVSPGQPIKVILTPVDTVVLVGREVQLAAAARDWGDNDVGVPIDLSVASPAITIAAGKARGVSVGRTAVIASFSTLRDTAWISVVPAATFAFYASPTTGGQDVGVYLMDSDGSNGRFLYRGTVDPYGLNDFGEWPAWSSDGTQIAFVEAVNPMPAGPFNLRILDVTGGSPRDLVTGGIPVSDHYGPQFDRLGRIHFTRGSFGSQLTIWRVPAAGGTAVQESAPVSAGMEAMPSPSPAGDVVAYQTNLVTNSPSTFILRLLDPTTGQVQRLDVPGSSPRWSPAGDRIAYLDATNRLQFMTSAGAPIASPSAGVSFVPGYSWSPDGQWIVGLGSDGLEILRVATREILPLALRGPQGQTLVQPSWRPVP